MYTPVLLYKSGLIITSIFANEISYTALNKRVVADMYGLIGTCMLFILFSEPETLFREQQG